MRGWRSGGSRPATNARATISEPFALASRVSTCYKRLPTCSVEQGRRRSLARKIVFRARGLRRFFLDPERFGTLKGEAVGSEVAHIGIKTPRPIRRRLQALADAEGNPLSAVIRRLLTEGLAREKQLRAARTRELEVEMRRTA